MLSKPPGGACPRALARAGMASRSGWSSPTTSASARGLGLARERLVLEALDVHLEQVHLVDGRGREKRLQRQARVTSTPAPAEPATRVPQLESGIRSITTGPSSAVTAAWRSVTSGSPPRFLLERANVRGSGSTQSSRASGNRLRNQSAAWPTFAPRSTIVAGPAAGGGRVLAPPKISSSAKSSLSSREPEDAVRALQPQPHRERRVPGHEPPLGGQRQKRHEEPGAAARAREPARVPGGPAEPEGKSAAMVRQPGATNQPKRALRRRTNGTRTSTRLTASRRARRAQ